jgi:hypothetical protein
MDMKEGKPYEYPYCISQMHRIGERQVSSYLMDIMCERGDLCQQPVEAKIDHSVITLTDAKHKMIDIKDKIIWVPRKIYFILVGSKGR